MTNIAEDVANKLADMPAQDLPVYQFLFPLDVVNCVTIFPLFGRDTEFYSATSSTTTMGVIDSPGVQIQIRHTSAIDGFARSEAIRQWLDQNAPMGYVMMLTTRSQPSNVTNQADLDMIGGPAYRFSVDFVLTKVRT